MGFAAGPLTRTNREGLYRISVNSDIAEPGRGLTLSGLQITWLTIFLQSKSSILTQGTSLRWSAFLHSLGYALSPLLLSIQQTTCSSGWPKGMRGRWAALADEHLCIDIYFFRVGRGEQGAD